MNKYAYIYIYMQTAFAVSSASSRISKGRSFILEILLSSVRWMVKQWTGGQSRKHPSNTKRNL